ncbi:MAG TPA: serine hydrolase domain-containing protein [Pilimelia sp.]|nr:serine hydrolase domain-containing protein [Pilimelia sp.]
MTIKMCRLPDVRQLTGTLAACARRHGVPGAQLVVHRGGTVAAEFGELEHGTGRRVSADTAFPVGSVTKAVTATAVLALVADGDLELDEPVGLHVPGLRGLDADPTVRQLLSHTSGLWCGPGPEQVAGMTPQRYIAETCGSDALVLPPGTGFSYSNVGYVLAGQVIASVTGMSWADAVAAIVLGPLGITADLIGVPGAPASGRPVATGHSVHAVAGRTRPVHQSLTAAEAAAGALALSARDLVALGRLHIDGGLPGVLPPDHAALLRAVEPAAVPFGLADGWGLGLAMFRGAPDDWFGHDGNADGTACYLRIDPAGGWVVALTTNANTGQGLWQDVQDCLRRLGVPLPGRPEPPAALPVRPAPECAGSFANGDVEYLVTVADGDQLRLSVDGDAPDEMIVCGDLTFYLLDQLTGKWSLGGRFVRDLRSGVVDRIQIGGRVGGRRITARI